MYHTLAFVISARLVVPVVVKSMLSSIRGLSSPDVTTCKAIISLLVVFAKISEVLSWDTVLDT